jgi:hypothetical protein
MLSCTDFFPGSSGVAGALTGLVFVSLSIAPERLTGGACRGRATVHRRDRAHRPGRHAVDLAVRARPGNNITASLVLGVIGLTSTAGLAVRLWRARRQEQLSNRWPFLFLVITALYGYQTSAAFSASSSLVAQPDVATLVFIFFGAGIAPAGELPGLRGEGLLDLLTTRGSGGRPRAAPAPGRPRRPAVRPGPSRDGAASCLAGPGRCAG